MNVILAIKNRRTIRKYIDKKVSKENIKKIIEAGTYAPSSHNSQPWNFVVIDNKKKIKELSEDMKLWYRRIIMLSNMLFFNKKIKKELEVAKKRAYADDDLFFYNAPVVVLVHAKVGRFTVNDCSCCAQNMLLAARSLGLGSCWIGLSDIAFNKSKRLCNRWKIPKENKVIATLIFGYPVKFPKKALPRKEFKVEMG